MAIQLPDILAPKQPPLHPADMPMEEDVTVSEVQQPLPQEGIAPPSAQQAQGKVDPADQGGILDQFTDTSGIGVSSRSRFNAKGANTYNPNYRYTNEDFYGPRGPDITWTDPRGVQMYVPRAGELPLGLWASRMQAVQGDLAQTRKGIGDLMKDTGMPKTASPYQADYTRLVTGAQQKYIDGIASQYGGDTNMAVQEISTEGSPANLGWRRLMANAEAIGQHVKGEWDQTGQWAKQLVEGKVNADPEMVQMAHEYLHGVGGLSGNSGIGDFEKAVKNTGRIRMEMGLDYFANQLGDKVMDEAYATVKKDLQRSISMGQRVIDEKTIKSLEDGIYKALVERAVDYTPSIDSPEGRARAERYFRFRYPQVKELKEELKFVNLPDGGSGGGGGGANTPVGTRMDATPTRSTVSGKHPSNQKVPFDTAPAITISTKVGNSWRPLDKVDVADGSGEYRMMVQPRFTYKDGEYVITGKMMDRTSELAITNELKKEGIDFDPTKSTWDNMTTEQRTTVEKVVSKYTKNESVPLRYNQDILSRNSGLNTGDEMFSHYLNEEMGHKVSPDEVGKMMSTPEGRRKVNEMMGFSTPKGGGANPVQQKAPSFVIAGGYTQKDWDGLSEAQRAAIVKKGKL